MKKSILPCVLLVFYLFTCSPDNHIPKPRVSHQEKDITATLIQLGKNRLDALIRLDSNQLKKMVSNDYLLTNAFGELYDLQDLLKQYQAENGSNTTRKQFTKSNMVSIYNNGTAAIVRGIHINEKTEKNGFSAFRTRYSDFYVKMNNKWTLVSSQETRIKASPL